MAAFDLIANPDRIQPPYGSYAVFLIAGAVLVGITVLALRRRWWHRKFLLFFAPVWIVGTLTLISLDARDVFDVRELVQRKQYTTVEGCLDAFHPGMPNGSKSTSGNGRWSLAGQNFDYGQGEARVGYHLVEARGGLIHSNSRVRATFVISPYYGRPEIIRLQTLSPTCPAAPDNG